MPNDPAIYSNIFHGQANQRNVKQQTFVKNQPLPPKTRIVHTVQHQNVIHSPPAPPEEKLVYSRELPSINAAVYPLLPPKKEVLILLKQVEYDLKMCKQKLAELKRIKQKDLLISTNFDQLNPSLEIQKHIGMIIPHHDIDKVTFENQRKANEIHKRYRITNPVIEHRTNHISHLPIIQTNIDTNLEYIDHLFHSVFNWKLIAEEKGRLLARQYAELRQIWENESRALNEYHRQEKAAIDSWPPEMIPLIHKPKESTNVLQFCANDSPMYLEDVEYYSYAFYSMNGFVPDPVQAHKDYKHRLCWTNTEKQIFLDKYRLHPREFKKIAAGLPQKSVKDVIEFYYCHRIDLNLKELEQQSRKRGRKKVITEGTVRK